MIRLLRITMLFALIINCSSALGADVFKIAVNDKSVEQDTGYPGCYWDHCKDKAKKLKKNYLKSRIFREFSKLDNFKFEKNRSIPLDAGLLISIKSTAHGSGRGYAEFASGLVTLGTAPLTQDVVFEIQYELYKNGKSTKSISDTFTVDRNISVLSNTQKYKKKAAKKIVKRAIEMLGK